MCKRLRHQSETIKKHNKTNVHEKPISSQISKFETAGVKKKKKTTLNLILIKWEFLWRQRSAAVVATSLFHVMKLYYI